ncbi:MAG: hypothetical protein AAB390_03630 [Patescibacteria group bacterium]
MNEDLVIQKLMEHDEKLDLIFATMATKDDFNRLLEGQDEIMKILIRLDEERIFTNEHFKRADKRLDTDEEKIDNLDKRVDKIELQFQPI